jgi:hypothetical protein
MDRFWLKVNKNSGVFGIDGTYPTECWEWTASTDKNGYGQFKLYDEGNGKQKVVGAHKLAWKLINKYDIKYSCHKCDNRKCVRPDHMYDGSPKTNVQDQISRNRLRRSKKYTDAEVRSMRQDYASGMTLEQIINTYNISRSTGCQIINGTVRKSAGGPIKDKSFRYYGNRYKRGISKMPEG